jgi:GNAT superfamily N-acetyltransferase
MGAGTQREVVRFEAGLEAEFLFLHSEANEAGWCRCVAWHAPTWDGWSERTAAENLAMRRELWAAGDHDAYLLRVDGVPMASVQVGPRARLQKLMTQFGLSPDDEVWALTCFLVAPAQRRRGHARFLLEGVLADLRARGVRRVEAYPRCGEHLEAGELWTGPESLYRAAGFEDLHREGSRSVWSLSLQDSGSDAE